MWTVLKIQEHRLMGSSLVNLITAPGSDRTYWGKNLTVLICTAERKT